jgi:hypothetical protein
MPVLDPDQHAALAAELAKPEYAGLDDAAAADVLNAPREIPNPEPRGQVLRPFLASEVMGMLDPATIGNLRTIAYLPTVVQAINLNDRPAVALWTNQLTASGIISPEQAGEIMGLLQATIPDPAWTETVPGPSPARRLFGDAEFFIPPQPGHPEGYEGHTVSGQVTPEMVAEARAV